MVSQKSDIARQVIEEHEELNQNWRIKDNYSGKGFDKGFS